VNEATMNLKALLNPPKLKKKKCNKFKSHVRPQSMRVLLTVFRITAVT